MHRFTLAILALAGWLTMLRPTAAAAQAPDPARPSPLAEGIAAFAAREPAAALRHFEEALAADSTSYEANWRAALALITLGAQTPDSIRSPGRDSLYAQAERYARRAVRADSNDAEGEFVLANALGRTALTKSTDERIKLAGEVRRAALRAIALDPAHDGAYHVLGRWNAEIMRLSGLSRFFARNLLGAHVFGQASWEGAISNMRRAVELDPKRIVHRLDLARIYVDRKRWDEARAQLDTLEELPVHDFLDPQYKEAGAALLKRIAGKGTDGGKRGNS
ncbi:MAG TPA: tetratricopeptide repeat protein [Gemmatimonadales bacterium]|nr:tetratricopeptide repeat protein [Gemmatimonadales bacterium]